MVDDSKIAFGTGECEFVDGVADCELATEDIPAPGGTVDLPLGMAKVNDEPGDAGKLTVTVAVEGDSNEANDSKTVTVELSRKSGVDLLVVADDVTQVNAEGAPTGEPIPPGESSIAWGFILNQGDRVAAGLKVQVKLPEHVTFAEEEAECDYSADNRTVKCDYDELNLIPADADSSEDLKYSSLAVFFPVTVSEDAEGPVALQGGQWTVAAAKSEELPSALARRAAPAAPELPSNARGLTAGERSKVDVDTSDNTDGFAVLVAGPVSGGGGGEEEPGLPITGPVAASVAGAGAAVLALGVVLLLMARRRRVVLVTPGDEK
jgi:hypothetical protein